MSLLYNRKKPVQKLQGGYYIGELANGDKYSPNPDNPYNSINPSLMFVPEDTPEEPINPLQQFNLYKVFDKVRGASDGKFEKFINLLGTISHTETRRKNIRAHFKKNKAEPTSSAKGFFQITNEAFRVDKNRINNAIRDYDLDPALFGNIRDVDDIRELSAEDQAIVAFLHMHYSKKIPLTNYLAGKADEKAIYIGWVSDYKDPAKSTYVNNEHLKNLKSKQAEIEKGNLNEQSKIEDFLFGGNTTALEDLYKQDDLDVSNWVLKRKKAIRAHKGLIFKPLKEGDKFNIIHN